MLAILSLLGVCDLGLGAPVLAPSCTVALDALDPIGGIRFVTNYRSTPEIIWTCIVTTCLCTWVSMHPDIVGYNSKIRHRFSQRVLMFLVAFIAPEFTLLFAAAQWKIAQDIVRKFGKRKSLRSRLKIGFGNFIVRGLGEERAGKIGIKKHDEDDGMCLYNINL